MSQGLTITPFFAYTRSCPSCAPKINVRLLHRCLKAAKLTLLIIPHVARILPSPFPKGGESTTFLKRLPISSSTMEAYVQIFFIFLFSIIMIIYTYIRTYVRTYISTYTHLFCHYYIRLQHPSHGDIKRFLLKRVANTILSLRIQYKRTAGPCFREGHLYRHAVKLLSFQTPT